MDINLLTNKELNEKMSKLKNDFDNCKSQIKEAYDNMKKASKEYMEINEILKKREGKNDKRQ